MRLFVEGEAIPNDYYDEPDIFNGVDPVKFDLDGDGRAGGSLPRADTVAFECIPTEETTIIKRGPGRPRKVQA